MYIHCYPDFEPLLPPEFWQLGRLETLNLWSLGSCLSCQCTLPRFVILWYHENLTSTASLDHRGSVWWAARVAYERSWQHSYRTKFLATGKVIEVSSRYLLSFRYILLATESLRVSRTYRLLTTRSIANSLVCLVVVFVDVFCPVVNLFLYGSDLNVH